METDQLQLNESENVPSFSELTTPDRPEGDGPVIAGDDEMDQEVGEPGKTEQAEPHASVDKDSQISQGVDNQAVASEQEQTAIRESDLATEQELFVPPPPAPHAFMPSKQVAEPGCRRLLFWIAFLEGLASLLPWNTVLIVLFKFEPVYSNMVIQGFALASFVFSLVVSFFGTRISPSRKVLVSVILLVIVSVGFTVMTGLSMRNVCWIEAEKAKNPAFKDDGLDWRSHWWFRSICIVLLAGMSLCGAVGNNGFFGVLPAMQGSSQLIQAYSNGQGISGFLTAVIAYLVWRISRENAANSTSLSFDVKLTFYVFVAQVLIPFGALLLWIGPFIRSREYQESINKPTEIKQETKVEESKPRNVLKRAFVAGMRYELSVFLVLVVTLVMLSNSFDHESQTSLPPGRGSTLSWWQRCWLNAPASGASKSPKGSMKISGEMVMLAFQFGDSVSRLLPLIPWLNVKNPDVYLAGSLVRFLFVGWLVVRHTLKRSNVVHAAIYWLTGDWLVLFMFLLTGITNGYLCLLSMMNAGPGCPVEELRPATNTLMPLWLFFGIFIGSLIGWVMRAFVLT